jgi:hypothetical protein
VQRPQEGATIGGPPAREVLSPGWREVGGVPVLIVIRETQRAATRATAVELSPCQFSGLYRTGAIVIPEGAGPVNR